MLSFVQEDDTVELILEESTFKGVSPRVGRRCRKPSAPSCPETAVAVKCLAALGAQVCGEGQDSVSSQVQGQFWGQGVEFSVLLGTEVR